MEDQQVHASDMAQGHAPLLSVILATPNGYLTIRKTVSHLRSQAIRGCWHREVVGYIYAKAS